MTMTAADSEVSDGQNSRSAVGKRPGRLSVDQVVAAAVLLGAAAVLLALTLGEPHHGAFELPWLKAPWVALVMLGLTCLCHAEFAAVRMRHGDAVEELTLLDGVVLLNTLLLPLRVALLVTLVGILLPYVARRLDARKLLYNLGVYATASSVAVLLVHTIAPAVGEFGLRLVVAMVVATAAFVGINLLCMAALLSAIGDATPREVLRDDVHLSVLTVLGAVGMAGTVLAMAVHTPVLLPCVVLPAAALRFAYGASAAKLEERRRSSRVLAYSQLLASGPTREVAVAAFLGVVREDFDAMASLLVFADGTALTVDSSSSHPQAGVVTTDHQRLTAEPEPRVLEDLDLPFGWQSAMTAPVVVDGGRVGTVVVGAAGRTRFRPRELTALSSLVGTLAVALQNADHMVKLVEETSKLRAVVDQASDGIVVLGPDRAIQVWSPAMAALTGVPPDEALGRRLGEVLAAEPTECDDPDPFGDGEGRLSPEAPQCTLDTAIVRRDGERRATRFSHAGVFDEGVLVRDVVIVRDLTAEWQVQRMKSDFIATVSHELRTPLTPIKGYAGMLRKRGDTMSPEKRDRALDVIVDRAEHLGRLVEDLLAASSITANQEPRHALTTDSADLVALVARACEDFPAAAGRLHVEPGAPSVQVVGDPTRVVQIMSNLVSNALKYSPSERPVHVVVELSDRAGTVTVTDHGEGIPADQLERVFDKFHRVEDPMVMSTGGTGLGLFIARQFARAMGGDVHLESTLGTGSSFTLSLPLHEPEAERAA